MNAQMMMTSRKTSSCAICENYNLASICPTCVNYRLNEYNTNLILLKSKRDALYMRLSEVLVAKGKVDDQHGWKVLQNEKLSRLREKLQLRKEQLLQGKAKIRKMSHDLNAKYELLESAGNTLEKNRVEQIEKYYPNLVCTQSLEHMAITHKQSVIIKQICKLFPQRRVNVKGERKDVYTGLYHTICNARLPRGLDPHSIPSDELAASLGPSKQVQEFSQSVWNVESAISSSTLMDSSHVLPIARNAFDNQLPSSAPSYLFAPEFSDMEKNENLIEGWEFVEHPTLPPPPSQTDDIEHWTRAMFIDATKK